MEAPNTKGGGTTPAPTTQEKLETNEALALAAGREPTECAECGHEHWYGAKYGYGPCPLRHEGCDCKGQPE